jgi:NAD(P)-dependent dehydrogenase (short-subunit alcohol dehydrogenase family)
MSISDSVPDSSDSVPDSSDSVPDSSDSVPDSQPRVLVIGARGALGALVADAFRRRGWAVRGSSRDPVPPPDFQHVDLTDPATLAPALDGVDLVITTVPDPALAAERHVLKHGGTLLNLSAEPATALQSLRRQAGPPEGTVVMNAGLAPGVTNLLAAELRSENPDADEVELVFTVTAQGTGGAASAAFAHRGFTGRGHHRVRQVTLPQPFGSRRVLGFAEPDRGWLGPAADLEAPPGGAGARPASSRGGGEP